MDVFWFEQTIDDVPAGNAWLSAHEMLRLEGMRFEKRRADLRLGRWTAKSALAACLDGAYAHSAIDIRPAPSGAPEVYLAGRPAPVTISLSHRGGVACCAVASGAVSLGCDLELAEPRGYSFVSDYFTAEEQATVARAPAEHRAALLALLWSAKESALKALRVGLRQDTRSVVVAGDLTPGFAGWHPLHICSSCGELQGWWQMSGTLVRTVAAAPPPLPPKPLERRGSSPYLTGAYF